MRLNTPAGVCRSMADQFVEESEWRNQILEGDCLEILKKIPDNSISSIVTDPPYGLGSKEPTSQDIINYLGGGDLNHGGDFMGYSWSIPSVAVWKEVYRVLKPGGYVLAFAGTRTFDLMSIGIRAAGFENRDTIASQFGPSVLQWVYGSGMPKSHNVSKAISKIPGMGEKAKSWEGYGTALKPAFEPILMFRKPIQESTVAAQVLATSTGAINIDATRVKHASKEDLEKHAKGVQAIKERGGSMANSWKNSSDLSGANDVTDAGRWPANVLMVHSEDCVKGDSWQCVPGCPVAILDEQSGDRPSTLTGRADPNVSHEHPATARPEAFFGAIKGGIGNVYADSGGASRFFQQFEGQPEIKAPFLYQAKSSNKDKTSGGLIENKHPTTKPTSLMKYLVQMVTPKGGTVLDPYCGSGSTCVAAAELGMNFVGIERDPQWIPTARGRVEYAKNPPAPKKTAKSKQEEDPSLNSFDQMMSLMTDSRWVWPNSASCTDCGISYDMIRAGIEPGSEFSGDAPSSEPSSIEVKCHACGERFEIECLPKTS